MSAGNTHRGFPFSLNVVVVSCPLVGREDGEEQSRERVLILMRRRTDCGRLMKKVGVRKTGHSDDGWCFLGSHPFCKGQYVDAGFLRLQISDGSATFNSGEQFLRFSRALNQPDKVMSSC